MESIQKIILIAGIPGSGKTTLSKTISNIFGLNIIETDYIYFDIADELKINGIKGFPNCPEWWKYDKDVIHTLKVKEYKKRLTNNSSIIEGFGLCFKEDREIIKELYPNANIFFLYKKINYHQWLAYKNNNCTKLDCDRSKMEYEDLMNMVDLTDMHIDI